MSPIALIVYCCQLGFIGIVLWFVVEQLTVIPPTMRRVAQSLLALILILAAVQAVVFGPGAIAPIFPSGVAPR